MLAGLYRGLNLTRGMKGFSTMASIEYKSGVYNIGPSRSQEYTFWWGSDGPEYFNVSIAPDPDPNHQTQLPLIEERRAMVWDGSQKGNPRVILLLTLHNDNNFAVNFIANHVRIY